MKKNIIIYLFFLIGCSTSPQEEMLNKDKDSNNKNVVNHVWKDSLNGRTYKVKEVDGEIVGGVKVFEYYNNGTIKTETTLDKDGVTVLGYVKEYDSLSNLKEKKSYWYSEGFKTNILNEYITGRFNQQMQN